jgi:protein-tyrosine phosphatase
MSIADPTRIDIDTDPETKRMTGTAMHGNTPFDVPFISKVGHNLWQGGCETGLVLPRHIKHLVSLYPWERYAIRRRLKSELYVEMFDSEEQGYEQVDALANWINLCRTSGAVLVHCQAGLNRSSLVAARALYLEGPGSGDLIINHLRDARSPACLCNAAFEAEVRSWS